MNKLTAYNSFFKEIISTINSARYQAYKSLNKFHIGQNFEIGRIIVENQEQNQWGQSIVDSLSKDINKQIDGAKGYASLPRAREIGCPGWVKYRFYEYRKQWCPLAVFATGQDELGGRSFYK